jgi:hypothetical protein
VHQGSSRSGSEQECPSGAWVEKSAGIRETRWQQARPDAVRGCPRFHTAGSLGARTYDGQARSRSRQSAE